MENTKANRQHWLQAQPQILLKGIDKKKLIVAANQLNNALSKKRKVKVIARFSELGDELWGELREELWGELREELREELRGELREELRGELREELGGELWGELREELRGELWGELWGELGGELRGELGGEFYYITWEYYETIWPIFIREFYPQLKTIKRNKKKIDALVKLHQAGNAYICISQKTLYVLPFPQIKISDQKRLHSTTTYACKFANKKTYWLNGIKFDYKLWRKVTSKSVKAEDIFAIENLEQRRAAYEIMDKTKMKQLKDYEVLDEATDDLGKPMKIISFTVKGYDKPFIYYQCVDASTDREYLMETDKTKCWEAKAASFGLPADTKWGREY